MIRIALATAIVATGHDEDSAPLLTACQRAGMHASVLAWDDPTVSWSRFDAVLVRATWDYTLRIDEFLHWCGRVDDVAMLLNPIAVLKWNTDKHYLAGLDGQGVPVVPGIFVEPHEDAWPVLRNYLDCHPHESFVVKPAISAGARDTQRYSQDQEFAAASHIADLLDQGRSVLVQPYLRSVDTEGETGLVYFDGRFSHSIRKGPLLTADQPATHSGLALGDITVRAPAPDELALAERALEATGRILGLATPLAYARVDIVRDGNGLPRLLELELTEPSLFFAQAPAGCADKFANALNARLVAAAEPSRTVGA